MTLRQMRCLLAIARHGSLSAAAHALYISQPSLSSMVQEVEREVGFEVFERTNRGVQVTARGHELLGMVRQVVAQDDMLRQRFGGTDPQDNVPRFSASAQHYSLGVDAFCALMRRYDRRAFSFDYRETTTQQVIDDVKAFRSQVGLLYMSPGNEAVIGRELREAGLAFEPLFVTEPCVLVSAAHPLAGKGRVRPAELARYPRISFSQGSLGGSYFAEEPLTDLPFLGEATVCDRNAMIRLLEETLGYTVATGSPHDGRSDRIVELGIETDQHMQVGYITHARRPLTPEGVEFVGILRDLAAERNGR